MLTRKSVRRLVEKGSKQPLYAAKLAPTLKTLTSVGGLTMSFTGWSPGDPGLPSSIIRWRACQACILAYRRPLGVTLNAPTAHCSRPISSRSGGALQRRPRRCGAPQLQ
jgi:hypothetical protein